MTNGNPRCGFRALRTLVLVGLATALPVSGIGAATHEPGAGESGRAFDLRTTLGVGAPTLTASQSRAVARLRAELPGLLVSADERTGAVRTLSNASGYLTGPNGGDAERVALDFVSRNADLFGLSAEDLRNYEVTDRYVSEASGVTHLYLRQQHAGLAVYNAQLHANVAADGRILSINNQFVPGIALAVNSTRAAISADEAVAALARHLGVAELGAQPSEAQLMLLPIRQGEVRLVWNFNVDLEKQARWYDVTVDALDGRVWTRFDWVADVNDYRVYQRPVEAPTFIAPLPPADGRTLQNNPANVTASPFGWHDTNGVAGNEFTRTRGNNVHAYTDIDANNTPDAGSDPECGATIALRLPARPDAAAERLPARRGRQPVLLEQRHPRRLVPLRLHPGQRNFQVNTYGGGGIGNDDVQAEAQDGAGTNNANFGTPPDGSRPRMQMFIWTAPTPDRDGDVDNGIIVHEYGHGISNRLVGGGTNVSCLQNAEQPGEGLSDWWSLFFTHDPASTDVRGIGTYALNQPITGPGIRTQRYDKAIEPNTNTWTYASVMGSVIPHGVGEKWAQAYWYVMGRLEDEHGFNSNVYAFTGTAADAGNIRAMYYIIEGLENAVCSPGFVDVRNAIIAAATTSYGGEDVCLLWQAFADYGLGFSASQGSSNSINDQVAAFDIPPSCVGGGGGEFCATVSIPIPDNNPTGISNILTIPDTGTLTDLNLSVTLQPDHTWIGDLIVRLAKGATTVIAMDRPGVPTTAAGCNANLDFMELDDESAGGPIENPPGCNTTTTIINGDFTPNNPLAAFDGAELAGDWTITISDHAGADTGTLVEWCVIVEAAGGGEPDIVVDPTSIDEEVVPGASVTVPLDIENIGTADLDWTIEETEAVVDTTDIPTYIAAPLYVVPGRAGERAADLLGTGTRSRVQLDRSGGKSSVVSATQGGGAILNQLPNGVNGFFSDAACSLCGTGQQSIADNFALSGSETIGTITIWSGYFPGDVPNTTDHWSVILHANAGGLPGAPVYTENDVDNSAVQTGIILFGVHEWEVTLTLATPQVLAPGTYWLEVFNNSGTGGSPDDVFWETGNPDTVGNGITDSVFAQQVPGVTWLLLPGELAVQLDGPGGGGGCSPPEDAPWLSLDETAGTTAPGDTSTVQVTLDAASLGTGTFEAVLCIESNDPDSPQVEVPVTFTVSGEPDIDVTPTSLTSSLGPDEQETQTLDIENLGNLDLDWSFEEAPPAPRVSIPASDGNFPRGRFPASTGMAPRGQQRSVPAVGPQQYPFGTTPAYSWNSQAGMYYTVFDLGAPEVLPNVAPFPSGGFIGAGEYVDGLVYMVDTLNTMWEVDPATGAILDTFTATAPPGGETYSGMALDPTSGTVYAGSTNITNSTLFTMDVTTGTATVVGSITNCPGLIALAIDGNGDLWGYDIVTDVFLSINKTTGAGTVIGPIGFDANFGQGMGYDPVSDTVYMAAFNGGAFQAELRSVDTATGNTTLVGVLGSTDPGGLNQLSWLGLELGGGGPCSAPSDLPWVSVDPTSGTTAPAATSTVDVTFDSTGLAAGTYEGFLCVNSNDPDEDLVEVPVTLTVDSMPFLDGFETGDTSRWSFALP